MLFFARAHQLAQFTSFLRQNPEVEKAIQGIAEVCENHSNGKLLIEDQSDINDRLISKAAGNDIHEFMQSANEYGRKPIRTEWKSTLEQYWNIANDHGIKKAYALETDRLFTALTWGATLKYTEDERKAIFTLKLDEALTILGWPEGLPLLSRFTGKGDQDKHILVLLITAFSPNIDDDSALGHDPITIF